MNSPLNNPTFIIKTLGCKVNQYESELMRENLINNGFYESRHSEIADFYIINSCTVTHKADRDTRRIIRHFYGLNSKAKIIVAGCYAELDDDRQVLEEISGVTHLVRNNEKKEISNILTSIIRKDVSKQTANNKFQISNFRDHDRTFVKIQDGCNHRCSYCKVALVRGESISKREEEVLEEIKGLLKSGYKEIVLTGICLGAWGRDFKTPARLPDILKRISALEGEFRIRLSSIEPVYIDKELIEVVRSSPKICRHFHIPLQSGDDKILKLMNRPYNRRQFFMLLKKIRSRLPDCAFTTDIMVGFPGEDDNSFRKTFNFIKKIRPSRSHIFTYSRRVPTKASGYGHAVNDKSIKLRKKILSDLTYSLALRYAYKMKNKPERVLIETQRDRFTQLLTGYTDTYLKVLLKGPDSLFNRIIPVRIKRISKEGIFAIPRLP